MTPPKEIVRRAGASDAQTLARIIAAANRPVAERFGLTRENAPTHPSLCEPDWVETGMERGEEYFLISVSGEDAGCVACEFPTADLAYLNRLAVLPAFQGQGLGRGLVDHVLNLARERGRGTVSIGIIAGHRELKAWYETLGFVVSEKKEIPHLPFDVLLMTRSDPGKNQQA